MSETDLIDKFNLLDKAAKKSDRWWFFALLVIGMVAVGFLYTDMRKERREQDGKLEQMHASIEGHLGTTISDTRGIISDTKTALDRNTQAIEKNTATLLRVEDRLTRQ